MLNDVRANAGQTCEWAYGKDDLPVEKLKLAWDKRRNEDAARRSLQRMIRSSKSIDPCNDESRGVSRGRARARPIVY